MPGKLILLRHGQSTWNKENRFTGWTDVDLTEQGGGFTYVVQFKEGSERSKTINCNECADYSVRRDYGIEETRVIMNQSQLAHPLNECSAVF